MRATYLVDVAKNDSFNRVVFENLADDAAITSADD